MINECRVSDVASAARDGVAPELRQEGALRESDTNAARHAPIVLNAFSSID